MSTVAEKKDIADQLMAEFETQHPKLSGKALADRRREAMTVFAELGIPNRKVEDWKYTNVKKLFNTNDFALEVPEVSLTAEDLKQLDIKGLDAYKIVLVNGRWSEELSDLNGLPEGVTVQDFDHSTENPLVEKHFAKHVDLTYQPFAALNTAYAKNGVFIHVPKNTQVNKPVWIVNIISGDTSFLYNTRNLFVVDQGAELSVIESQETVNMSANALNNQVSEIIVGTNASCTYDKLQNDCERGHRIDNTQVEQERDSRYTSNTITIDGEFVRNDANVDINGENVENHLFGLYLPGEKQHVDNHTRIEHIKPNCESNELYKGVAGGKGTGVFNGRVHVHRYAQKTNAFQSNANILLTDDATVDSKPELEIYADDVKCSHGSTTGQLDEEAMFYLRSRGLSEKSARSVLLIAFAADVINNVKNEALQEHVRQLIEKKLERIS